MTLNEALMQIDSKLDGRVATDPELAILKASLPSRLLPEWISNMLRTHPLIGSYMELDEQADQSGVGVEMYWLRPESMLKETNETEPGLTVCQQGLLPIGSCAAGSGDPYFLDLRRNEVLDPPVVRILHDFAGRGDYPEKGYQVVAPSLSSFLLQASIG